MCNTSFFLKCMRLVRHKISLANESERFDGIVSRLAFRDLNNNRDVEPFYHLGSSAFQWLLATQVYIERGACGGLIGMIHDSVSAIVSWKSFNSDDAYHHGYLNAACGAVLANRGMGWVDN